MAPANLRLGRGLSLVPSCPVEAPGALLGLAILVERATLYGSSGIDVCRVSPGRK